MPHRLLVALTVGVAAILLPAAQAAAQCGMGGSCFQEHGPGCDDSNCCSAVRAVDLFCCFVSWDAICIANANDFCASTPIAGPFTNPANGHQYYVLDQATWLNQQASAKSLGGSLVVINSAEENQWVTDMVVAAGFAPNFFIGLSDIVTEGEFRWVDDSPLGFTAWDVGQPDNAAGAEDVVQIWTATGAWNDLASTAVRIAVAEIGVEEPGCGDTNAGSCYLVHGRFCDDQGCCESVCLVDPSCCEDAWDAACVSAAVGGCQIAALAGPMVDPGTGRTHTLLSPGYAVAASAKAASLGQRLVTIEDGRRNEFVRRWMLNELPQGTRLSAWIGANDRAVEGTFAWESGAPFDFSRWAPGEPNNLPNEDAVAISAGTGMWQDAGAETIQCAVTEAGNAACGTGGDCFSAQTGPQNGPGCHIEACCNSVCLVDPVCCTFFWDGLCAFEATTICTPTVVLGPIVNPATGSTYYRVASTTWAEGERLANSMGGHLAVPNTVAERIWLLMNLIQVPGLQGDSFLGIHDQLKEGAFQTVDSGDPVLAPAWAPGEPDNLGNQDVVVFTSPGFFRDVAISTQADAIIEVPCRGDLDGDHAVAAADLAILIGSWGFLPGVGDLTADGFVDAADLAALLGEWGPCPTSDCCTPHGFGGCGQPGCQTCVCAIDPSCCSTTWDAFCVSESAGPCKGACQCGGQGGG